ncbi:MAG: hypothetical protein Q9219_004304 [cf. Caloplaca sp. 3 TL-2023]
MEAAGFAVGIVSLYNACIDILSRVDAYKDHDIESQALFVHYEASKVRLQDWADRVGIRDGKIAEHHSPCLDDPKRYPIIKCALEGVRKVFNKSERSSSATKLPARQPLSKADEWTLLSDETRNNAEPHQPVSKRSRLAWAMGGRDQLKKDVNQLDEFVNALYHVTNLAYHIPGSMKMLPSSLKEKESSEPDAALKMIRESFVESDRREILDWLDALKYDDELAKNVSSHLDGTCKWILDDPSYFAWRFQETADTGAKFLWVNGPPGFGKTVLTAWVIQHMRETLKSPVAYCFSSTHARKTDEYDGIVRTWIAQLAQSDIRVLNLCKIERRRQNARRASLQDIWNLLREVSIEVSPCAFVLDGLDEFSSTEDARIGFLKKLKNSIRSTSVKVWISSRDEVDIHSELSSSAAQLPGSVMFECKVSRGNVNNDIELYTQSVVAKKLPSHDELSRREWSVQLAERAGGMFLWVKLQQNQFRNTQNKKTIQRTIHAMPHGLGQTYERSWNSILDAPELDRNRAIDILRWLMFGYRPLTVQELTEALMIQLDESDEAFCEDDLPGEIDSDYSINEIKGLCRSLVELRDTGDKSDPQQQTVHLVHSSVRDYLINTLPVHSSVDTHIKDTSRKQSSRNASHHIVLAACCFRFLDSPHAWNGGDDGGSRAFTEYAVYSCYRHLRGGEDCYDAISSLVHDFFRTNNIHYRYWREKIESHPPFIEEHQTEANPMYYACAFGLLPLMDFLRNSEDPELSDINSIGGLHGTPLQAACLHSDDRIFNRLMSWGVDVTVEGGWYHNALNAIVYCGSDDMLQAVLQRQSRTDLSMYQNWEAIKRGARYGVVNMVKLLLDRNVLLSSDGLSSRDRSTFLSNALLEAANFGRAEIVSLLLDQGAPITACDNEQDTPLHKAVRSGNLDTVKVLLEQATVHGNLELAEGLMERENNAQITALHLAAIEGHTAIADLLLARGAYKDVQTRRGSTPLFLALRNRHPKTANLLLDHNVDVSLSDAKGFAPIHKAAENGLADMVKRLIERDVDVNSLSCNRSSPLHEAVYRGHLAVVELLLHHGADIGHVKSGDTPLHVSVNNNNLGLVTLLIQSGADFDAQDEDGWTPLHLSAESGNLEVTDLLLRSGAKPNARTNYGATPLHTVMYRQDGINEEQCFMVVKLLVEFEASYTADEEGWFPIHEAAARGYTLIVIYFYERGYPINVQTKDGRAPLRLAVDEDKFDTAKIMLRHGADPKIADRNGKTALHRAVERDNLEFAQDLIANGSEIDAKTIRRRTSLHYAIYSYSSAPLIEELIRSGANLFVPDWYGMTCFDWLRRLRPRIVESLKDIHKLDNIALGPDVGLLERNTSECAALLRKGEITGPTLLYDLYRSLLMLDMEDDARLAYQWSFLLAHEYSENIMCCSVYLRTIPEDHVSLGLWQNSESRRRVLNVVVQQVVVNASKRVFEENLKARPEKAPDERGNHS